MSLRTNIFFICKCICPAPDFPSDTVGPAGAQVFPALYPGRGTGISGCGTCGTGRADRSGQ